MVLWNEGIIVEDVSSEGPAGLKLVPKMSPTWKKVTVLGHMRRPQQHPGDTKQELMLFACMMMLSLG